MHTYTSAVSAPGCLDVYVQWSIALSLQGLLMAVRWKQTVSPVMLVADSPPLSCMSLMKKKIYVTDNLLLLWSKCIFYTIACLCIFECWSLSRRFVSRRFVSRRFVTSTPQHCTSEHQFQPVSKVSNVLCFSLMNQIWPRKGTSCYGS